MIKRAKPRSGREGTGLWARVIGLLGVVVVVGVVAVFAALPFLRSAPPSGDGPEQHHTETLAGRQYETVARVGQDGSFEVRLSALGQNDAPTPPVSARVDMRGGGMTGTAEVVQEGPGVFAIRGTLPMRGDWDLTLTAAGQSAVVTLPNNWSF